MNPPQLVAPVDVAGLAESVGRAALQMRETMGRELLQREQLAQTSDLEQQRIDITRKATDASIAETNVRTAAEQYQLDNLAPALAQKAQADADQTQATLTSYLKTQGPRIEATNAQSEALRIEGLNNVAAGHLRELELKRESEKARQAALVADADQQTQTLQKGTFVDTARTDPGVQAVSNAIDDYHTAASKGDFKAIFDHYDALATQRTPEAMQTITAAKNAAHAYDAQMERRTGKNPGTADYWDKLYNTPDALPILTSGDPFNAVSYKTVMGSDGKPKNVVDESQHYVTMDKIRNMVTKRDTGTMAALRDYATGLPEAERTAFQDRVRKLTNDPKFDLSADGLKARLSSIVDEDSAKTAEADWTSDFANKVLPGGIYRLDAPTTMAASALLAPLYGPTGLVLAKGTSMLAATIQRVGGGENGKTVQRWNDTLGEIGSKKNWLERQKAAQAFQRQLELSSEDYERLSKTAAPEQREAFQNMLGVAKLTMQNAQQAIDDSDEGLREHGAMLVTGKTMALTPKGRIAAINNNVTDANGLYRLNKAARKRAGDDTDPAQVLKFLTDNEYIREL